MKTIALVFVISEDQPYFTRLALERLFKYTPTTVDVYLVLNGVRIDKQELLKSFDSQRYRVFTFEQSLNYSSVLNLIVPKLEHDFLALVHDDVLLTSCWLQKLIDVFDQANSRFCEHEKELLPLVGVTPYQNYNEHSFFIYENLDRVFVKVKPPSKTLLTEKKFKEIYQVLFNGSLERFVQQFAKQADSWYTYVPEISSSCVLLNLSAFKRICEKFDERFVSAGGEIRYACRQLKRAGYRFARADTCFVYHHGNLTNDGTGSDYRRISQYNNEILRKTEVE